MMKLSTATGYIYGFVQDVDSGMWQYIVLDFDTGKTVLTVDVASLYGYNNMAIGMYAGRDGNKLYCPTGYKELLRLQDRFVFLPEMPYRKVDLDKTSRRVLSAAEFQSAGGAGTPASWLHTATLDNLHTPTTVDFRINGLTGNAATIRSSPSARMAATTRCPTGTSTMPRPVSARRRSTLSASPHRTAAASTSRPTPRKSPFPSFWPAESDKAGGLPP